MRSDHNALALIIESKPELPRFVCQTGRMSNFSFPPRVGQEGHQAIAQWLAISHERAFNGRCGRLFAAPNDQYNSEGDPHKGKSGAQRQRRAELRAETSDCHGATSGSPVNRVLKACSVTRGMVSEKNRTEPSAKEMFAPPGCWLP